MVVEVVDPGGTTPHRRPFLRGAKGLHARARRKTVLAEEDLEEVVEGEAATTVQTIQGMPVMMMTTTTLVLFTFRPRTGKSSA